MRAAIFIALLIAPSLSFAVECPAIHQVQTGNFTRADNTANPTRFDLSGIFDVNHDIYQRWGIDAYGVDGTTMSAALNTANAALHNGNIRMLSKNATCSGGDAGSLCICTYQITINKLNYQMEASSLV